MTSLSLLYNFLQGVNLQKCHQRNTSSDVYRYIFSTQDKETAVVQIGRTTVIKSTEENLGTKIRYFLDACLILKTSRERLESRVPAVRNPIDGRVNQKAAVKSFVGWLTSFAFKKSFVTYLFVRFTFARQSLPS